MEEIWFDKGTIDSTYQILSHGSNTHVTHLPSSTQLSIKGFSHLSLSHPLLSLLPSLPPPHFPIFLHCNPAGQLTKGSTQTQLSYYVTHRYSKENLRTIVSLSDDGVQENVAKHFFKQILTALKELHRKGVFYGTLTGWDLWFGRGCRLLLTDFRRCGRERGTSSEFVPEGCLGVAADVFLAGNVLRGMVFNDHMFGDKYWKKEEYKMIEENYTQKWFAKLIEDEIIDYIPDEFQQLLVLILQPDPALRPSISEILQHEWLSSDIASQKELETFMQYIIYTAQEDFDKAGCVSEDFPSILGLSTTWKPTALRHFARAETVSMNIEEGWWTFTSSNGEELFNKLLTFIQHNCKEFKVTPNLYEIKIDSVSGGNDKLNISIGEHQPAPYVAVISLVFISRMAQQEYMALCERLQKFMGTQGERTHMDVPTHFTQYD